MDFINLNQVAQLEQINEQSKNKAQVYVKDAVNVQVANVEKKVKKAAKKAAGPVAGGATGAVAGARAGAACGATAGARAITGTSPPVSVGAVAGRVIATSSRYQSQRAKRASTFDHG